MFLQVKPSIVLSVLFISYASGLDGLYVFDMSGTDRWEVHTKFNKKIKCLHLQKILFYFITDLTVVHGLMDVRETEKFPLYYLV